MDAKQYHSAITLSTAAALKNPQISLPEIIGVLEMTKLNVERSAYQQAQAAQEPIISRINVMPSFPPEPK